MTKAPIDARRFRDVLGSYPTGVCVITACANDGRRHGLVVGSFTSVSLDPPLVGFFPGKQSSTWRAIDAAGRFCVNVLGADQLETCRRFSLKGDDKFQGLLCGTSPSGQPLLDNAVAWIDCTIDRVIEVGDHWFVVGGVEALGADERGNPLLFYRGGYHDMAARVDG